MKKTAISLILFSGLASIASAETFQGMARVEGASPLYRTVETPGPCHQVSVTTAQPEGGVNAGAIVGAIAGGLLGNTVGQGNGRIAATGVGAAVGALTGQQLGGAPQTQVQTVCDPSVRQSVVAGYSVQLSYHGHFLTRQFEQPPAIGSMVPVTVTVN